jgi:hypothetical protein
MSQASDRAAWFSIQRVLRRAWTSFLALWPLAIGLSVGLSVIPDVLVGLLPTEEDGGFYGWTTLPLNLLALYAQSVMIVAALAHQRGLKKDFGASVRDAGASFAGVIGVSILSGLGEILGLLLLVVPGLWLITVWSVAIPARLMRSASVTSALDDSRELTKGVRWQVFALALVTGIVVLVPAFLAPMPFASLPQSTWWISTFVLTPFINAAGLLIIAFGSAALYHELRWGPGTGLEDDVAAIFA